MSASVGQPNALDRFARGKLANMHADLGAAYAGLAMFDESVREYAKALDLCPEFADLRVRLGNVYRDMGVFHAAVAEFEHAKRLRPDFIPARIHLGVTLFSLGRKDDAIAEWQHVLTIDPANKSAQLYIRMASDEHGPQARQRAAAVRARAAATRRACGPTPAPPARTTKSLIGSREHIGDLAAGVDHRPHRDHLGDAAALDPVDDRRVVAVAVAGEDDARPVGFAASQLRGAIGHRLVPDDLDV